MTHKKVIASMKEDLARLNMLLDYEKVHFPESYNRDENELAHISRQLTRLTQPHRLNR